MEAMTPVLSILISSHQRLPLLRRTLWGIANRPPSVPFEVVLVDDGSTDDVLGELKSHSSRFQWTFVRFDSKEFEAKTGLKKVHNNPSATNNLAFRHARGNLLAQQGNEVISVADCYDRLIFDAPIKLAEHKGDRPYWLAVSTTYDVPKQHLAELDEYGTNVTPEWTRRLYQWPLQSQWYRSDVTNYVSLAPRALWEKLGGYDERYYAGIAAEDSDFVRRARTLDGFQMVISEAVSLHQNHNGRTTYQNQDQRIITNQKWDEGCAINRATYDSWDGTCHNRQKWPIGSFGVAEVVKNWS